MHIIKTNEQLLQYIPNTITTVKGETSLFDKLAPFLQMAEQWIADNVLSNELLSALGEECVSNSFNITAQCISYEAFRCAIPSLDLILTPNGFGIVNNTNVVPASKERVDRLIGSMESMRDKCVEALLNILRTDDQWLSTTQAEWFRATLFPSLSFVKTFGNGSHLWDSYLELREQLINIETEIATAYISPELLCVLHEEEQKEQYRPMHKSIIQQLQAIEVRLIKTNGNGSPEPCPPSRQLRDIITIIREHEEEFPEWHNSATAELFMPKIFKNQKKSSGYWF